MNNRQRLVAHMLKNRHSPWILLGIGLLATVFVSLQVKQESEHVVAAEFSFLSDQVTLKIQERLEAYALVLRGAAGLFAASLSVERPEWRAYVETLQAQRSVSGVEGIGFSQAIAPDQLAAHIARIREEGFPEYTVWPSGERDLYTSIIYLEPFRGRNLRAFGYDMFSEPVRRAAMENARDTGGVALSGKVKLVQENGPEVQAGTLLYVPVYRNGAATDTVEQRRSALVGWTYSPYRMHDLMNGILTNGMSPAGKAMDLRIYDGREASPASLLFGSASTISHSPLYQQRTITFGGHEWLLAFDSTSTFSTVSYTSAWSVLIAGLALSGLLCGLMRSVLRTRASADRIANELTLKIRSHEKLLAESEYRWRFALEGSGDGLWDWNLAENTVFFSTNWKEMLGFTDVEIGNRLDEWSQRVHPDDLAQAMEGLQTHFDGKTPVYANEQRVRCKDGSWKWILARGLVVSRDAAGKPLRMIGTHKDITKRKAMEAKLIEALLCAETAAAAKSEFLAMMSHELRSPLNGILGFAELLSYTPLNAEQDSYARTISSSGNHLLAVVNDILDFSSMEKGHLALHSTPTSLAELVESSALAARKAATDRGLAFRCEVEAGVPEAIIGDERRIRQILINLLGNAVKFTSAGSVVLRVAQASAAGLPALNFSVTDTGSGISPETLGRLFQPFAQADSTMGRPFEGTGLGLAISRRLAEAMGGSITVVSTQGQGSTFTLRLPLEISAGGTAPSHLFMGADGASPSSPSGGAPIPLSENKLVLVVEDLTDSRQLAGKMLESLGYRAEFAANGAEAVAAFAPGKYFAILMDVLMPVMDGLAATKKIRELESGSHVSIIALTANMLPGDRERCLASGMDDFLSKPFTREDLAAKLAR